MFTGAIAATSSLPSIFVGGGRAHPPKCRPSGRTRPWRYLQLSHLIHWYDQTRRCYQLERRLREDHCGHSCGCSTCRKRPENRSGRLRSAADGEALEESETKGRGRSLTARLAKGLRR